jgi:hypothetical protein
MHTLSAAMNLKNKAFGQLKGFDFNSFCSFGGRTFGASGDGLFEIVGVKDLGKNIEAWFDTVLSDWGSSRLKRPRAVILSGEFAGGVALEILDGKDEVLATLDLGDGEPGGDIFVFQKTAPRTVSGRYWKFRVRNVDGSFVHVDQLEALFTLRPYGASKTS